MTSVVLVVLVVCVCLQPTVVRGYVALLFVGVTLLHEVFEGSLDGLAYYGSAALCDLAIIVLTSGITPVPAMVTRIHLVCFASIVANAVGWVMWSAYLTPTVYNAAFVLIYIVAVAAMLKKDPSDVGGHSLNSRRTHFRSGNPAIRRSYLKDPGGI